MNPLERFEHYAAQIAAHNDALNAYVDHDVSRARKAAEASQRRHEAGTPLSPIDGWCIAVKANIAVKGYPLTAGIAAYRENIAEEDAELIRRLRDAGAVVLGMLNMHEGALGATTDNAAYGRTQNPWRHGHTPGGSSGGSGAAVAAGLCDVALGSDTMGSVRIPSAYCGVQGHKPTTGRVPDKGLLALSHTLDHVGPHARRVAQLAPVLSVLTGVPITPQDTALSRLRIGLWKGAGHVTLSPAVSDGFEAVAAALENAGANLSRIEPPAYDYGKARRAGLLISEAEGAEIHDDARGADPAGFSDTFASLLDWGAHQPAEKREAAYAHIKAIRAAAPALFETVDCVIAPTAPQQAFSFDADVPANQADFTAWANFAALPATAIFTGLSADGLPLSCQVIGAEGRDAETLGIAAALESRLGPPPSPPGFD